MSNDQQKEFKMEILLAQQKECFTRWLDVDRMLWQIPTTVSIVNAGMITIAYAYIGVENIGGLIAREALLLMSLIITLTLTFSLFKHRYMIDMAVGTMIKIEDALRERFDMKCVQRYSMPESGKEYYYATQPGWFSKRSAHRLFIRAMLFLCVVLVVLIILNVCLFVFVPSVSDP